MQTSTEKFMISFWNYTPVELITAAAADMWNDLGITVGMFPRYGAEDKEKVLAVLDRAQGHGIKVILCDYRTIWHVLTKEGEKKYRELFSQALKDFGSHPAVFGFYCGDEPDAPDAADAFKSVRIQNEMAPHLCAYLNLLPWFDWIGERMGTDNLANYLDRYAKEGKPTLLGYDCYTQMFTGDRQEQGVNDYFFNLNEYRKALKRHNIPFINTVLSIGHYDYRCPSKDDMLWQLTTSAACGATGVSWFFVHLRGILHDYRNAPINQLGGYDYLIRYFRIAPATAPGYIRVSQNVDVANRGWNEETNAFFHQLKKTAEAS